MQMAKEDAKEKTPDLKEIYAEQGMKGVLALLDLTPQAARAELEEILKELPPLPPAAQVFAAFDPTKAGGGRGEVGPVLKLLGLTEKDLAPGASPWAEREVMEKGKVLQKLIISLADGRKVSWARP